ncbi:MAG: hypothetical protein V4607_02995 [Pseudomonadota bacterium]
MSLTSLKDGAMSIALKAYLNDKFKAYGEVLDCEIDTVTTRMSLHALLHGESAPVTVAVERYDIKRDSEGTFVLLLEFSSSRSWVTTLLNSLFAGKRYSIPSAIGALL